VAEPTTAFVTDIVFDRVAISLSDALRFAFSGMLVNARNSLQLRAASRRGTNWARLPDSGRYFTNFLFS
jgi:hypothetical protein